MNILVIGATGGSGRAVCDALLGRGHRVTAVARHADALPDAARPDARRRRRHRFRIPRSGRPGHDAVDRDPRHLGARWCASGSAARRERPTTSARAAPPPSWRRLGVPASAGRGAVVVRRRRDPHRCWALVDRVFFALLIKPQIIDSEIQEGVLRGSELDWTIVQPVHLSDDESVDRVRVYGRPHPSAQGVAPSGRPRPRRPRREASMIGETVSVSG